MGSPSIFVYDCSNAGLIVKSFKQFALQREQELEVGAGRAGLATPRKARVERRGEANQSADDFATPIFLVQFAILLNLE